MSQRNPTVEIKLTGQFRIRTSTGDDCTPRGRKACGLVAMLALSPEGKRSRVWLQDQLWGSRGKEQAAASLRQTLFEVRRALGEAHTILVSDKFNVALDLARVETDLGHAPFAAPDGAGELLEGFDLGEEGFEEWLREHRLKLAGGGRRSDAGRREAGAGRHEIAHHKILLVRGEQSDHGEASILADSLVDSVAKTITELAAASVVDQRDSPDRPSESAATPATLSLRSEIFAADARQLVRLVLLRLPTNSLAWSSTLALSGPDGTGPDNPEVMRCVNQIVNVVIDQFAKEQTDASERTAASNLCYTGIARLFRLGKLNFQAADTLFAKAFEIEPRGIYLAWRAYLRTFLLAERQYVCWQTTQDEALGFMWRALELEPHNSYVAALSAHVHTMMRRSYVAAYELAERSVMLNHANPIGWACLGIAKSYLGKSEEGFRHTVLARSIAGSSPFRYQLDALSCIAGTMAGDFDKAIHLAEASHAMAPTFAPPLRYLSALYAHRGDHERSFEMVQKLQANEPDFSYDKLRDKSYPAAGLHRTPIIGSLPKRQI